MFATPALAAAVFAVPALPIAFWVAWNDMAHMKIPNLAVLALLLAYAVIGPFVLPLADYGWRWGHFALILVLGFAMNMAGMIGAGDAKFAAAMAPYVAAADAAPMLYLFAAVLLAAFVSHRALRALPAFRNAVPHWKSWERSDFPMGLALGGALGLYLVLCVVAGR
jgi:prepilin peptidase CpaA